MPLLMQILTSSPELDLFCLRWCRFTTERGFILRGNRKQHLSGKLFKSVSFRTMVELRTQSAEARCYNECFFMTEMEKDSGHTPPPPPHTHTENTATPRCTAACGTFNRETILPLFLWRSHGRLLPACCCFGIVVMRTGEVISHRRNNGEM